MEFIKIIKKKDCYIENDVCFGIKFKNKYKNKEYVKLVLLKEFIIQEVEMLSYKL